VLYHNNGNIYEYLQTLTQKDSIDNKDLDDSIDFIKDEVKRSQYPMIFQITTYKNADEALALLNNLQPFNIEHIKTIQKIESEIHKNSRQYFMETQSIAGDINDKFELVYSPDAIFFHLLQKNLKPYCEQNDVSNIKDCLNQALYNPFRIQFDYKHHFTDPEYNITIKADGLCSIRALQIIYCNLSNDDKFKKYACKDLDLYDITEYEFFKMVIENIIVILKDNTNVKDKTITLFGEIQRQVNAAFSKLNKKNHQEH
jgi:hypothetical protein